MNGSKMCVLYRPRKEETAIFTNMNKSGVHFAKWSKIGIEKQMMHDPLICGF
jgi:hypothetical protein